MEFIGTDERDIHQVDGAQYLLWRDGIFFLLFLALTFDTHQALPKRDNRGARHAAHLLEVQQASRRVLLILSDGKPNDLDLYEGRYGIEDTRMAIIEAKRRGLQPFCVTIDREGPSYLPHLFGPRGYAVIRRPDELPKRLPMLYAQLTR